MNDPTSAGTPAPRRFMQHRIHKILLICCSYDGYILEEDGHIEQLITREYVDLKMSNPPSFTRVGDTAEALALLERDASFDFILTMYNVGEPDVFVFARMVKERWAQIPVVLLTSFSKDVYRRIESRDCSGLDSIFCWHGNAELIIAIIKLMEDKMNAPEDIFPGGVQAILLVEDSVRFYSTYLPELYKLLLQQNTEFLKDALNEQQQVLRKRARPKVLLANNYEQAVALYRKYADNLLGVISDVGFVLREGDAAATEKCDAGIDLCRLIKEDNPLMPVLLQSSQTDYAEVAARLGAGFIAKNSKSLLKELSRFIRREFGFGDFCFRDLKSGEVIARAKDLLQMQQAVAAVPDDVLNYNTSQNNLSKWLNARGLFPLAASIRQLDGDKFRSTADHRAALVALIRDYRMLLGQGVVAHFDPETYSDAIGFARLGEGSLGGKARGLAFLNSVLQKYDLYDRHAEVRIVIPRTAVVATDYFDEFIRRNGLESIIASELSDEGVLAEFVSSQLPDRLIEELRAYIRTVDRPLAVRSSSKLEDSHYQPFAGIYSTYMIPRTRDDEQTLRLLLRAIKSVYASVYFAASRAYIQTSQNLLSEEKMAVIVQEVCGTEEAGCFFPTFSGVARSINCYPLGDERPEEGICHLAMGLGKAVVEGSRTLRFSPAHPQKVLQTSTPELALRDTQKEVHVLSLHPEAFRTSVDDCVNICSLPLNEVAGLRNAVHVMSTWDRLNGRICDSPYERGTKLITFNNILKYNTFPIAAILRDVLAMGAEEMRCPVEVEFAANMDVGPNERQTLYLLQIRPIIDNHDNRPVDWSQIDPAQAIVYSGHALGVGRMNGIADVVYVRPEKFDPLKTCEIAEELLAVNARMHERGCGYVLVGPGRWGSSDPFLGVPVKWTHISEAKVIVETTLRGFSVEPSQGTHFFQNVTSLGVGYLTIDEVHGDGRFDSARLDRMAAAYEGEYLRAVHFDEPLEVCIDGRTGRGYVGIGNPSATI